MGSYGLTGIYLRLSHRNNKNGKAVISATKFEGNFAVGESQTSWASR